MTVMEYVQLKAFARIDGALLSLIWLVSFACQVMGILTPALSMVSMALAVFSLYFVVMRVRRFRDKVLEGVISFRRGWAYVMFLFFYGGLLFAVGQYAYFAFLDQGFLFHSMSTLMEQPEAREVLQQYGMTEAMTSSLEQIKSMRPIDVALQFLTSIIFAGILFGLPIAAFMRNNKVKPSQP